MFAEIVVNAPLSRRRVPFMNRTEGFAARGQTFTYAIPAPLEGRLQAGQLVTVPFGARKLQGIVMALADQTSVERVKDVYDIVDPLPVLSSAQIALARWMSEYYFAPLIDCVLQMFPPGLESEVQTTIALNPEANPLVNPKEIHLQLVERLRREGPLPLDDLLKGDRKQDVMKAIDALVRRHVLLRQTVLLPPRAKARMERTAQLIAEPSAEMHAKLRSARQRAVLDYLLKRGGLSAIVSTREVMNATHTDSATLKALAEASFIRLEERAVWRDPLRGQHFTRTEPPTLTDEQQRAWEAIQNSLTADGGRQTAEVDAAVGGRRSAVLLFGVTGSGKTEIYLRAVAATIVQGRQAIVLVPEIALTPQTIRRFAERFPNQLTVIHSQLSLGERYDQWRRIRAGEVNVVIGARSAIFAPLPRLGLIVLDEEHEPTYKQDKSPRYHAREVALQYAQLTSATVILGSATPSLETMWQAKRGEYRLLTLTQRITTADDRPHTTDRRPPTADRQSSGAVSRQPSAVEIVDMRDELKAGNTSIFSRALRDALTATLAAGEQAILFLNRRGSATFVMCRDCGFVMKCRRCDNPLTFHADQNELQCHHCGRRYAQPAQCPNCFSKRIKRFGAGTQRVEEVVHQLFPTAHTLRWDRDVTGAKGAHDAILKKFVAHEAEVLIGTQMIAKGLDLPLVTLVGVVSADTSLHLPDFRASERTFQLLTQVAGRAGRSRLLGKAIFQTYAPTHPAIVAAAQHDYEMFYQTEIEFRQRFNYPPFSHLIRLLYAGKSEARAQQEAESLHRNLSQRIRQLGTSDVELVGPAPCFIRKVRGEYRWQIIVKGQQPHELLKDFVLPLGWRVDVDPMSVL